MCREGLKSYNIHTENCSFNAPAHRMPTPDKKEYNFSVFSATCFVSQVIFFDFESILRPDTGRDAETDQSSTRVIKKHNPCEFALAIVDHHSNIP